jgi:ABC-type cobalamin/Fe3+-siderophores transport system ATPase subunit
MRLKKIKLAGFKSFVDPTTVDLPSSLVGIVGPNGCGKSNVIDAVRWVMGPPVADASLDSVSIMNPGRERATVTVTLLRERRDALVPEELAHVSVAAGAVVRLPFVSFTEGAPLTALVVSDRPVVAERFAHSERSRDVSTLMGMPLTTTP